MTIDKEGVIILWYGCTSVSLKLTRRDRNMVFYTQLKARSSGGERYLDTVEVGGSKPPGPTMILLLLSIRSRKVPLSATSLFSSTVTKT
jgi:hypothetical protein